MPTLEAGEAGIARSPVGEAPYRTSLMTSIGLAEGELLSALEKSEVIRPEELIARGWSTLVIFMAMGSLIRSGLVRAVQFEKTVYLVAASKEKISK